MTSSRLEKSMGAVQTGLVKMLKGFQSKVLPPLSPKVVTEDETNQMLTPSEFLKEMSLTTEQKLANTRVMCRPQIIELLDMGETTHQKFSGIDLDQALFQPFPSEIVFQNYSPCEVYEVPLVLRNNDKIPRMVKVIEESSPYFKVISPKDIGHKVAPGVPSTFRILFTPEENKDYAHLLTCVTEREKFIVPIKAVGARAILDFPDKLNFSTCPVKYSTQKVLLVRNIGNKEAIFHLETRRPFSVEPSAGTLNVGETMQLEVEFEPQTVGSHFSKLIVSYDTGEKVFVSLYGAAIDMNIRLDKNSLIIEKTYISLASQRTVTIHNRSSIIAHFQWKIFANQDEEDSEKNRVCDDLIQEQKNETDEFLEECILDPSLRERLAILSRTFENQRRLVQEDNMLFLNNIFTLEPLEGDVWPNSSAEITVYFNPVEARLYQQTVYCNISGREIRLPLRIKGEGMGPQIHFNFELLDIGKVFIGSVHCYETILTNKGSIDALFNVMPPATALGACFVFSPKEGILEPSRVQAIQISFSSSIVGYFEEEFLINVHGSPEPVKLTIRGCVIGPTFHFNVPALNFGDVSFGFPHTLICSLNNTSLVPMTFKLRVPGDGPGSPSISTCEQQSDIEKTSWDKERTPAVKPREFTISPSCGTIRPQGFAAIRVTLCSNTVQKYELALVVDVEGIGEEVLALLITARCVVPALRLVWTEVDFGRCFLKYPYKKSIQLINPDDLPGFYEVLPQQVYKNAPGVLLSSPSPCGLIPPHSTMDIPLALETQVTGEHWSIVRIFVFGSPDPPMVCRIKSIGEGPVVYVHPTSIDFGQIYVLKDSSKVFYLSNQSFIPASFQARMARKNSLWTVEPTNGTIPPESEVQLVVTANLDDTVLFKDTVILDIKNSSTYRIQVQASGIGSTIVSDKPFAPELNLGAYFSLDPFYYRFKLANRGRRVQKLFWMNYSFLDTSDKKDLKKGCGDGQLNASDYNSPVFQIHPVRMELYPGQIINVILEGYSDTPRVVKEKLVCHAIIGAQRGKNLVMIVNVICEFIAPLIQLSTKELIYRLEKKPNTVLESNYQPLAIKNVSTLPVHILLSTTGPFFICETDKSPLPIAPEPIKLEIGEEKNLLVKFDPSCRNDFNNWVAEEILAIKYVEHPQVDSLSLRGEVHYPNLSFETTELDFGCILNDTEVIRYVTITNSSPLVVKFRWSFLLGAEDSQIRFSTWPRKLYSTDPSQVESLATTSPSGSSQVAPMPLDFSEINLNDFVKTILVHEDDEDSEREPMKSQPFVTTRVLPEAQSSFLGTFKTNSAETERICPIQSQVEFQESLWIFDPDEMLSLGIEEVFDILPLYGVLQPHSSHQMSFTFYGHCGIMASTKALCEVEGGPTYEITLKGEASLVSYSFDTKEINYGLQLFDHVTEREITLKNTGKVGFEFRVVIDHQSSPDSLLPGVPLILPISGFIESHKEQVLKVSYLPGVPGVFHRSFQIQIAHLDPENIVLNGEGFFPRICLDLPRNLKGNEKYETFLNQAKKNLEYEKFDTLAHLEMVAEEIPEFESTEFSAHLQMEVERLIVQGYALEYQKTISLDSLDSSRIHRSRRKLAKVQLPEYILDFGHIVLGDVRTHIIKITNTSHFPVSFQAEKRVLHDTGFSTELDRVKNLPYCETETFEVRFDPQGANLSIGNKEVTMPIKVVGGPVVHICLKANVTIPSMTLSCGKVEFATIQNGQCLVETVQLSNHLQVPCEWFVHTVKPVDKLGKHMPKYLRRKLHAELKPKTRIFEIQPMSGVLDPGERSNVQVKFMPKEEKFYSQTLMFQIAQSTQKLTLLAQGQGLEPRLEFNPSVLELGPLLPCAPGDEAELVVKNPCSFPIEFYSLEFDQQYLIEEKMLRKLKGYDSFNTLLLPPRPPGEKLPTEVYEYFKELKRSKEEQMKAKYMENHSQENEEEEWPPSDQATSASTKRTSLSQGISVTSNMEERHIAKVDSKTYPDEEEEDESLEKIVFQTDKLQSIDSHSVEEVGEVENNPVNKAIARHLGIDISTDGRLAKNRKGIAIIVHGTPLSGKSAAAASIAKYYNAACLNIDSVVLEAISDGSSIPGIRARELCIRAAIEQSMREGEESGQDGSLNPNTGQMRLSYETLGKFTSESTLVTPEMIKSTKSMRGSVMITKSKAESHGSGSQRQHHMHLSETPQVSSSPLPMGPTQRRLSVSTSIGGETGLMSCVLPEELFMQILVERIQLNDCYRGVVFDGLDTLFARSATATLLCLLKAIGNREHIYVINMAQDYAAMKAQEKAKKEQEDHKHQEALLKEKERLQNMDEEEYDALTEEEKTLFDREVQRTLRERKKRELERMAREMQEKKLQQELERQREEDEQKRKIKRAKPGLTKEEGPVKKPQVVGRQGLVFSKPEVKMEAIERKISVKDQGLSEKDELNKKRKNHVSEPSFPGNLLTQEEESERDLSVKDTDKHMAQKFKNYELSLKDVQNILMFWDRKLGIQLHHVGTEDMSHEQDDQRQVPSGGRKGRKDRERERLEKERAEKERLEREKAERERLEKLRAMEERSEDGDGDEDHEGKKDVGVPFINIQTLDFEGSSWKQALEHDRLPKGDQILDILGLGTSGPPIPPPALFSVVPYPTKRLPLAPSEILKRFLFVMPQSEELALMEDKKDLEAEGELLTPTSTSKAQEEQTTPSKGSRQKPKEKLEQSRESQKDRRRLPVNRKGLTGGTPGTTAPLSDIDQNNITGQHSQEKFIRLNNFRWIVPANGEVTLRVHFSSSDIGNFDQTFNFEILGTRRQYQLYCRGVCTYPYICQDPKVVFPQRKKDIKANEIIFKKYVMSTNRFYFGPLLCGKSRDKYKSSIFPGNMETLTILNNSPMLVEVYFCFQHDVRANTYFLEPTTMILKPNEKQLLNVWAYPTAVGLFEDSIVCCIKENPEPATFKLACQGIRPELELDHKQLHFERLLLHRKESKAIRLRNVTPLPVAWRITNMEHLGEDFTASMMQGTIPPKSEYGLHLHFQPSKPITIKKAIRLEVLDADNLIGVVQMENILIFAESYDIALDITFPKGAEGGLDFGIVRVLEEVKQPLQLKNRGKYEIVFSFSVDSLGLPVTNLSSMISIQPKKGTLATTEKPTNVQVLLRAKKEVRIEHLPVLRCHIIEPTISEGGEMIASIPIKLTVNAVFSKYSISPSSIINFGALICGTRKSATFTIENQGVIDFKYALYKLTGESSSHQKKIPNHVKHTRTRESESFYKSGLTKAAKFSESIPKEVNVSSQARVTHGMFTVYPGFGSIPSGGLQVINVDCVADPVGRCEELIAIDISDRDPKDQPAGIPYTLLAEACVPAFVTDNNALIFEEHQVCSNVNLYHIQHTTGHKGLFVEDENKFVFCNVLVGHQAKARFKISNMGKIACDVNIAVKPVSNKPIARITDIFEVEPNKMCVASRSHAFATVTFTPQTMQTYQCIFEATLDGLPSNLTKNRNLVFDIVGEGNLPRVMVVRPILHNQFGNPLLLFKRLLLGRSEKLPLILKNNGTIPAQLHIDLRDQLGVFSLRGRPMTSYIYISEENRPKAKAKKAHTASLVVSPGETAEFDVLFRSQKVGRMEGTIHLSVVDNQYEETSIHLVGESYEDDITLENIHGLVTSTNQKALEIAEENVMEDTITAALVDHIQFGDCHIGNSYNVSFTISNHSQATLIRFEWPMLATITFSPQMGHLHPGCAKDVVVTLKSDLPITLKKMGIKCRLSRIVFSLPEDQVPDWDDRMHTIKWMDMPKSTSGNFNIKKKVIETDPEPAHTVLEEHYRELQLQISANVGFASYQCETSEVHFKDTLVYQSRVFEFDLINSGNVQLEFNWDPEDPGKAVSFAKPGNQGSSTKDQLSMDSSLDSATGHCNEDVLFPFSVEPSSGIVLVGKKQRLKVKFSPLDVGDFEGSLFCQVPNLPAEETGPILLVKGRSHLPFCHFELQESDYISGHRRNSELRGPNGGTVDPNTRVIEFATVGLGGKNLRTFTILNPTNRGYSFCWITEDTESLQSPPAFTCLTEKGFIHPEKKAEVVFQFTPLHLDVTESFWTFLIPEHKIKVPFLLVGKTTDPLISLDKSHLNLSCLLIGREARETVQLINREEQAFSFAFQDNSRYSEGFSNSLLVSPMEGWISPLSRLSIDIFFTPKQEGEVNFNLICNVKRKAQPLTLNVKAEGYTMNAEIKCKDRTGLVTLITPSQTSVINFYEISHGPTFTCSIVGYSVSPAMHFSFTSYNFGTCFIYQAGMPPYKQVLSITNKEEMSMSIDCLYTNTAHLEVNFRAEVIKPGKTLMVPITFYPRESISYREFIPFEINGLSQQTIEIKGKGTEMKILVLDPANRIVKLGAVLPGQVMKKTVSIMNNSHAQLTFNLSALYLAPELQEPKVITLTPFNNISLKPKEIMKVEVIFAPKKRIPLFSEEVFMECMGLLRPLFLLNGCCQALEISLDQDLLPFGAVVFQTQATRRILMLNTGDVGARFKWDARKLEPHFSITPEEGYITAGSEVSFEVNYHPTEMGKESVYKNIPCFIQGSNPLSLTLSGVCVGLPAVKEVVNFTCQVRSKHTQTILLSNRTNQTWNLHPIFEGEHWEGPEFITLEAHQQNKPYEITYRPRTMNVENRKHQGTLFFPLPDGTGWLYALHGMAELPKAVANIYREVPCKTPYTELLPITNWLNKPQRFRVIVEMTKPEKADLSITLKGLDYIDVLSASKKDYKLNFYSYKEGLYAAKVIFRNETTNEFLFYTVSFRVIPSGAIKAIEMTSTVRQSTSATIKLENPLPYSVTFSTECRITEISLPSQFAVPANSEGMFSFEFQPLKAGETFGKLSLHNSELGYYLYELNLKAIPALPEKPVHFQTVIGNNQSVFAKFTNYTRQKTEYLCRTDCPDFHSERVINAAAGAQGGTEVSVEVIFEPSHLGETKGSLLLSSLTGGEYVIPLFGMALPPKPQGPFLIRAGYNIIIPFKNVFYQTVTFSFIVENPAFTIRATDTVRPKKINNITVFFEGNPSGNKTPVTSKLIVSCTPGEGGEAIKWVYYLKGITP
ncbi:hydrocephalus-inducing protein homolog [Echinops telfairi]|uniref:Hydrocephalus-inducing protein homolog n=1 Tax=Echinops telfairi TaxID=9371 RepID=A0AC55DDN7_ECHTE|nr:hydrocephalus-inducing protein homolog [Echinops telfairi]